MKKILFSVLMIGLVLNIVKVSAETCNPDKISIESISIEEKNSNTKELEEVTSTGKNIKLHLSMNEIGDNITYKMKIKNDSSEDYQLGENTFNTETDYIDYSIETEDKDNIIKAQTTETAYLRVEYKNEIPSELIENDSYKENKTITLNASDNGINNPNTKRNIIILSLIILLIISTVFISIKDKKYLKTMILIIGITLPVITFALCETNIGIDLQLKIKKPIVEIVTPNRTKDTLQVGDEICVNGDTTECFNFIGYDGNNIKMLSKWNLKVGYIYETEHMTKIGEYTSNDIGYGLQSSDVRGFVDGASTFNGTVAFSATNYWHDAVTNAPKSDYPGSYSSPNYPIVFDPINYKGALGDNNYSVAYYVEQYKDKLEAYGITISNARLLTYAEAVDSSIGCTSNYFCPTAGFITNTTFWIGAAYSNSNVRLIMSNGRFLSSGYGDVGSIGVRPVIVIAKSEL